MKKNLILIFAIVGSTILHIGILVPIILLASGLVPLTEVNAAILSGVMAINAYALVRLHVWNRA
jgi:hypothetical protein